MLALARKKQDQDHGHNFRQLSALTDAIQKRTKEQLEMQHKPCGGLQNDS